MAVKSITFYFDIESPFSYVGYELLERCSACLPPDATSYCASNGTAHKWHGSGSRICGKSQSRTSQSSSVAYSKLLAIPLQLDRCQRKVRMVPNGSRNYRMENVSPPSVYARLDGAVASAGKYLFQDLRRTARLHGIPFRSMPVNSLAHSDTSEPFRSSPGLLFLVAALQRHVCDHNTMAALNSTPCSCTEEPRDRAAVTAVPDGRWASFMAHL